VFSKRVVEPLDVVEDIGAGQLSGSADRAERSVQSAAWRRSSPSGSARYNYHKENFNVPPKVIQKLAQLRAGAARRCK
jgi:hypothetical protein